MRFMKYIAIIIILLSVSCAGTNKRLKNSKRHTSEKVGALNKVEKSPESPAIKEVEEKLVPNEELLINPHRYFVIVGSFRDAGNAKKYKEQIEKEGFSSEILKNENGLYRMAVLATDEISVARDDIRRIRRFFPEHADTWLLIQRK